jgi:endoplasmic reticulum-Golgi intermediate compartment protein 3
VDAWPVTLLSSVLIVLLLVSEFSLYWAVTTRTELVVDVTRDQKMRINFNITFPRLSCHGAPNEATHPCLRDLLSLIVYARVGAAVASVDVMDVAGEHQTDIEQDIYKVPLNDAGEPVAILRGACLPPPPTAKKESE